MSSGNTYLTHSQVARSQLRRKNTNIISTRFCSGDTKWCRQMETPQPLFNSLQKVN